MTSKDIMEKFKATNPAKYNRITENMKKKIAEIKASIASQNAQNKDDQT